MNFNSSKLQAQGREKRDNTMLHLERAPEPTPTRDFLDSSRAEGVPQSVHRTNSSIFASSRWSAIRDAAFGQVFAVQLEEAAIALDDLGELFNPFESLSFHEGTKIFNIKSSTL